MNHKFTPFNVQKYFAKIINQNLWHEAGKMCGFASGENKQQTRYETLKLTHWDYKEPTRT